MIALHDAETEEAVDGEEPPNPPAQELRREEKIAAECREISYALHSAIFALAEQADAEMSDDAEDATITVSRRDVHGWLEQLRELNVKVSQYARMSVARADRLQIEIAMTHSAMASDVLDRESCHTHTLESIAALQTSDSASGSTDAPQTAANAVSRAIRLVTSLHSSTAPFSSTEPLGYFGAAECSETRC
jgi:hypothetical protein